MLPEHTSFFHTANQGCLAHPVFLKTAPESQSWDLSAYERKKRAWNHSSHIALVKDILPQPPVSNIAEIYNAKGKEHTQKSLPQHPKTRANNEQSQIIY